MASSGELSRLRKLCWSAASAAALLFSSSAFAAPSIEIDLHGVRVFGLQSSHLEMVAGKSVARDLWREILLVVAIDDERVSSSSTAEISGLPALLGSYDIEITDGNSDTKPERNTYALRFRPRFPPSPGLILAAYFNGSAWDQLVAGSLEVATPDAAARYVIPEPPARSAARVLRAMPSGSVPENLLRLYVHFSEPMSARHVLEHIRLLDADGEPVPVAFVEVPGGLWDPERRRLTLFIHPGRVKRGVGPNQALGPVLVAGERYSLFIDAAARDARGRPLGEAFEAPLLVGAADRRSPDPQRFRIHPPEAADRPLLLELDEPADSALLARLLSLERAGGEGVEARLEVGPEGRRVRIHAAEVWQPGVYRLLIPISLEDPSGNRVDRLFEEAPAEDAGGDQEAIELVFEVASFG